MNKETVAIILSIFSLLIAALSIGWNIYRDVILKARLKVHFMVGMIQHATFPEPLERLIVSATNFGPGKVKCSMLHLQNSSIWKRITKKNKHAILIHDYTDPLSSKLPCDLEIGEKADFLFKFEKDSFLLEDWTRIGVSDSFGRIHWAPKKDFIEAKKCTLKNIRKRV